jgi:hypothetical protein
LDFTVYFKDDNGNLCHEWFDFFSEALHDYKFTYEGLLQLGKLLDFSYFSDGVYIFADNGFHNGPCLYVFWLFSEYYQLKLFVNHFALHHGWSICDSHFGVGKQFLRTHHRLDLIKEPQNITELFAKIRNTTVTLLDQIPNHKIPEQPFEKEKEFRLSEHFEFILILQMNFSAEK